MNYIIRETKLTTCRKEKNCTKCNKKIKPKDDYYKYDDGFNYWSLCMKCYKKEIDESITLLEQELNDLS